MLRNALLFALIATPLAAQDKQELCRVTSGIAGSAVYERAAGEPQAKTTAAITADLQGTAADYAAAVGPIVAWVWTLPKEQLTDEVGRAYEAACLAQ